MVDNFYKNAFKEVYEILQNTENELVEKIPHKFIDFLKNNMNSDYVTNIDSNIEIDKQALLPETEDVLSLIYRSYWATDEEKIEFSNKDKEDLAKIKSNNKVEYKDVDEIFKKKQNLNSVTLNNNLMVIQKENFFQKLFKKILSMFKKGN